MSTQQGKAPISFPLILIRWILGRPRWQLTWGIALAIFGALLCGIKLFNLLAFEFAFACTIPLSFLGAYCALKIDGPPTRLWTQWKVASLPALCLGLIPLVPISLNALWVKNCNWLDGLFFYACLPLTSIVVSCGWGLLIKHALHRRVQISSHASQRLDYPIVRRGIIFFCLIFLTALLWGVMAFFTTPIVDVFSTFLGYYPGALYDEEMMIGSRLILSRLEDLSLIAFLLAVMSVQVHPKLRGLTGLFLILIHLGGWSVDLHRPAWWVQHQLGGERQTSHYRIYYPKHWNTEHVDLLATELEFNHQELTQFFQVSPQRLIDVYLYRNPQHKKRLMGAGRTLIAKPWHYSIHVHTPSVGDRVITHELAHVFSADIAPAPHHLSLWRGILPNMSLIEGLAVAAAWTRGRGSGLMSRLTPHQWTAAMRRLDLAPPVGDLFNPQSFYAYNARISYTTCGSFVRFYRRTRGVKALNALYASGGEAQGLSQAIEEWEAWLDQSDLSPRLLNTASSMLGGTSIFYKVCAHDLAARRSEAMTAEHQGEKLRALDIWHSIDVDKPRDAQSLLRRISILVGMDRFTDADRLISDALQAQQATQPFRHMTGLRIREWSVDLDWFLKRRTAADLYKAYEELLSLGMERSRWRRLAMKRYALSPNQPSELRQIIANLFVKKYTQEERLEFISDSIKQWPQSAELYYLKARIISRDHSEEAEHCLAQSLSLGLSHPSLTYEALRLRASLAFKRSGYLDAQKAYAVLAQRNDLFIEEGERQELELWTRRAQFFAQTQAQGSN